jgi:hypothetical protein
MTPQLRRPDSLDIIEPRHLERLLQTKEMHRDRLLALPNVFGVATGPRLRGGEYTDELVVQVFVTKKLPESGLSPEERIPSSVVAVDGEGTFGVDVEERSLPRPLTGSPADGGDTTRYRPVPGGSEIAWVGQERSGTLGGFAGMPGSHWWSGQQKVGLTCYHVVPGDRTIDHLVAQPAYGAHPLDDVIGTAHGESPYTQAASARPGNVVDAVWIELASTVKAESSILGIGPAIYEIADHRSSAGWAHEWVQKRGKATLHTANAWITSIDGDIPYEGSSTRLTDVLTLYPADGTPFATKGDSGALVVSRALGSTNTYPARGILVAQGTNQFGEIVFYAQSVESVFNTFGLQVISRIKWYWPWSWFR